MAEFTKEQLIKQAKKNIEVLRGAVEKIPGASDAAVIHLKLAEIALASLGAEPIGFAFADDVDLMRKKIKVGGMLTVRHQGEVALYTAPPAPVSVPDAMEMDDDFDSAFEHGKAVGWNAYRAAMLQGADVSLTHEGKNHHEDKLGMVHHLGDANEKGNSPVIPDGWVIVPVEPTEDMIVNGFESEPNESFSDERVWEAYDAMSGCQQAAHRAKLCWAAMISAARKLDVR
ncbi:hypothetical protein [Enterobacter sichuanensis]|uniref:hypothetical protein n=1 Tax=Enterobacter sichuanensis TaxID=2071710 RepID=UPI00047197C6